MAVGRMLLVMLLAACSAVGCRRSPTYGPLADVSGTVTVDGKPLDDGTVAFVTPATGDVQVFAVRDGRFAGRARVGERRVEFRCHAAAKAAGSGFDLPGPAPFPVNTLPDHLNSMSTITVTIAAEGRNEFTFDLETKPPGDARRSAILGGLASQEQAVADHARILTSANKGIMMFQVVSSPNFGPLLCERRSRSTTTLPRHSTAQPDARAAASRMS